MTLDFEKADRSAQLEAVRKNWHAIQYIKNPSKEVRMEAVHQSGYALKYIENPSKEEQLEAVRQYGEYIEFIPDPDKDVQMAAVGQTGYAIRYIKDPDRDVQMAAVSRNGAAIEYISNPDGDVQMTAVRQDSYAISYIENPGKDLQLEAVKKDGNTIRLIKDPDEDVQLAAVRQNGKAVEYIKNPSRNVARAAVAQNGRVLKKYFPNAGKEMMLAAVRQNGMVLGDIADRADRDVQLAAVTKNAGAVTFVKNPDDEMVKIVCDAVRRDPSVYGELCGKNETWSLAAKYPEFGDVIRLAEENNRENLYEKGLIFEEKNMGIAVFIENDALEDLDRTKSELRGIGFLPETGDTGVSRAEKVFKYTHVYFINPEEGGKTFSVSAMDIRTLPKDLDNIRAARGGKEKRTVLKNASMDKVKAYVEEQIFTSRGRTTDIRVLSSLAEMNGALDAYEKDIAQEGREKTDGIDLPADR